MHDARQLTSPGKRAPGHREDDGDDGDDSGCAEATPQ
jgi:hypothetical protein